MSHDPFRPVPVGLKRIPRSGPVLFMLGLVFCEATGRWIRGLGDHFHSQISG